MAQRFTMDFPFKEGVDDWVNTRDEYQDIKPVIKVSNQKNKKWKSLEWLQEIFIS